MTQRASPRRPRSQTTTSCTSELRQPLPQSKHALAARPRPEPGSVARRPDNTACHSSRPHVAERRDEPNPPPLERLSMPAPTLGRRAAYVALVVISALLPSGCAALAQDHASAGLPVHRGGLSVAVLAGAARYSSDWSPADDVTVAGLDVVMLPTDGGIHGLEFGVLYGNEDTTSGPTTFDAKHLVPYVGWRIEDTEGDFHPFVSLGIDSSRSEADRGFFDGEDTAIGGYIRLGARVDVTDRLFVGLEGRYGGIGSQHEFNNGPLRDFDSDFLSVTAQFGVRLSRSVGD